MFVRVEWRFVGAGELLMERKVWGVPGRVSYRGDQQLLEGLDLTATIVGAAMAASTVVLSHFGA